MLGIDPAQLLWAIAGQESSFGKNCVPRHEDGYCYGSKSYRADKLLRDMTDAWGCAAHCSYGPWQIMFYNAYSLMNNIDPVILLTDAAVCAEVTVMKLNTILAKQPRDVRDIADAWNSGNFKDDFRPLAYMDAVQNFYSLPAHKIRMEADA
jgi:hypothetical protein